MGNKLVTEWTWVQIFGPFFQIFRTLHMNITYIIRNLVHIYWMNLFLRQKIQIPVCWELYDTSITTYNIHIPTRPLSPKGHLFQSPDIWQNSDGSRILDAWSIILSFSLIMSFYQAKPESRVKIPLNCRHVFAIKNSTIFALKMLTFCKKNCWRQQNLRGPGAKKYCFWNLKFTFTYAIRVNFLASF